MDEDPELDPAYSQQSSQSLSVQSSPSHSGSNADPPEPIRQQTPESPPDDSKSPAVQTVIIKSANATDHSGSQSLREGRPHIKKQPKLPKFTPSAGSKKPTGVPLVSSASAGRDTYDLDMLQDPKTQRAFQAAHRFQAQPPFPLPRSLSPPSSKDYILRNIASAGEKSAVKATLGSRLIPRDLPRASSQDPRSADFEHLLAFGTQAELRRKQREEEMLRKEMSECSFRPTILPTSQRARSPQQYYQYMLAYQQRVSLEIQAKRDEADSDFASKKAGLFHPTLCTHSRELATDSAEPRYEYLYKQHKARMVQRYGTGYEDSAATDSSTASSAESLFKPKINAVPRKQERAEPVSQSLNREAVNKANRQQQSLPVQAKLTDSGSNTLLKERFSKEFQEKWFQLEPHRPDISYTGFVHLLTNLHLIANNPQAKDYSEERTLAIKAWSLCAPPPLERSSRITVQEFLLAVMNLWTESLKSALTAEKSAEIRTDFGEMYSKRVGKLEKLQKQDFQEYYGLTFHPTINPISLQITRGNGNIGDLMFSQAQKQKENLEKLRDKMDKEELKDCIFTPEVNKRSEQLIGIVTDYTNDPISQDYVEIIRAGAKSRGHALYQLAGIAQERQKRGQRTVADRENETNMVECTFVPDLSLTRESKEIASKAEPVGMDKTVERLRKAREQAERVKGLTERGYVQTEAEPVRFTVDHKYKSIPVFDPAKAPAKMVGSADGPRLARVIRGKVVLTPTPPPSVISPLPTAATPSADPAVTLPIQISAPVNPLPPTSSAPSNTDFAVPLPTLIPAPIDQLPPASPATSGMDLAVSPPTVIPAPIDSLPALSSATSSPDPAISTPALNPVPIDSLPPPSIASPNTSPESSLTFPTPLREPLLSVSITVSEGVKDDLVLYTREDINSVVQAFATKHELSADHAARLVELLEFQVAEIEQ